VLELPAARLRGLVQTDPELMEILLGAFILRRLALVKQGGKNVALIGSHRSAGTLVLREFLTRNQQPFACVFAVGDVRANSVKRIAAAVGEGSVCVQLVHKVLAEQHAAGESP
jgi:hypothetical protein